MKVTMQATRAMWNVANPPTNPFCELYMTVIRPNSVPVIVAMPRHIPNDCPAQTKSFMLEMYFRTTRPMTREIIG